MRFLMTLNAPMRPPDQELFAEMGRFVEELSKAGVLIATGGLGLEGTHVTSRNGKVTVVDGPYPETKETIISFALVDVGSKDEALALSRRFFGIVGDGEGDLRQVFGPE
ncbi:YciI family protein [Asanoa sp. NPDC050611]|uniref:YciI family protein n=1 Tax=Asanoa sp. NPDC050611 TaxID=3157098 RepID=UPI0033DD3F7E